MIVIIILRTYYDEWNTVPLDLDLKQNLLQQIRNNKFNPSNTFQYIPQIFNPLNLLNILDNSHYTTQTEICSQMYDYLTNPGKRDPNQRI